MISDVDASTSTLHLLVWQALQTYTIDALLPLLDDEDSVVRTAVARELQARGDERVFEAMLARCNDQDENSREIAAFTLGQLGTPNFPFRSESTPCLINLVMSDSSSDVRAAAVAALGHLHAIEGKEALLKAARDVSDDVRATAAVSLGKLGNSPDIVQMLQLLLCDDSNEVREWAEVGLDIAKREA